MRFFYQYSEIKFLLAITHKLFCILHIDNVYTFSFQDLRHITTSNTSDVAIGGAEEADSPKC